MLCQHVVLIYAMFFIVHLCKDEWCGGKQGRTALPPLTPYVYHVYVWGVDSQIVPVGIPFVFYRSIMGLHSH